MLPKSLFNAALALEQFQETCIMAKLNYNKGLNTIPQGSKALKPSVLMRREVLTTQGSTKVVGRGRRVMVHILFLFRKHKTQLFEKKSIKLKTRVLRGTKNNKRRSSGNVLNG